MSNLQLYKEQIEFLSELQTKIIKRIISLNFQNRNSESLENLRLIIAEQITEYKCCIADEILPSEKVYNIVVQAVNELYEVNNDEF